MSRRASYGRRRAAGRSRAGIAFGQPLRVLSRDSEEMDLLCQLNLLTRQLTKTKNRIRGSYRDRNLQLIDERLPNNMFESFLALTAENRGNEHTLNDQNPQESDAGESNAGNTGDEPSATEAEHRGAVPDRAGDAVHVPAAVLRADSHHVAQPSQEVRPDLSDC